MKFRPEDKYTTIAAYAFLVILFTIGCVIVMLRIDEIWRAVVGFVTILNPLIYGFVIAYLLNRPCAYFEEKFAFVERKKPHKVLRRALSLLVVYLLILLLMTGFILSVVPQVVESYGDLQSQIYDYVSAAGNFVSDKLQHLSTLDIVLSNRGMTPPALVDENGHVISLLFHTIEEAENNETLQSLYQATQKTVRFDLAETFRDGIENFYRLISGLTPYILNFLMSLILQAKDFLMGLIISVYFLLAREKLLRGLFKCCCAVLGERRSVVCRRYFGRVNEIFFRYCSGMLTDAFLSTIFYLILLTACNFKYAPLLAVVMGMSNLIPYIGPLIGFLPSVFIVFLVSPSRTILFCILVIVMQLFDSHVIDSRVLHNPTILDPVWILIAVIVMSGLFGIWGMLMGVPLFSVIYMLCKEGVRRRLEKKHLPTDTAAYVPQSNNGDVKSKAKK